MSATEKPPATPEPPQKQTAAAEVDELSQLLGAFSLQTPAKTQPPPAPSSSVSASGAESSHVPDAFQPLEVQSAVPDPALDSAANKPEQDTASAPEEQNVSGIENAAGTESLNEDSEIEFNLNARTKADTVFSPESANINAGSAVVQDPVPEPESDSPGQDTENQSGAFTPEIADAQVLPEESSKAAVAEPVPAPSEEVKGPEVEPAEPAKEESETPVGAALTETPVVEKVVPETEAAPDSPPLLPKGSYNIDFDNLDLENFNPFGNKAKISEDSALPAQSPKAQTPQSPPMKPTPKQNSAKKPPAKKKVSPAKKPESEKPPQTETPIPEPVETKPVQPEKVPDPTPLEKAPEEATAAPDSPPPLPPKGSYNIDFDSIDLENFNPFGTKSKVSLDSALPSSPPVPPVQVEEPAEVKKPTPKKPVAKKASPKKAAVSPKKGTPKKSLVQAAQDEDLDDSFHDAVEEIEVSLQAARL